MACTRERADRIGELASGRLDAAAAAELLQHVEGCPSCSAELELVADLVSAGEGRELSTAGGPGARAPARPRTALRLVLGAGLAAAAALVLFLAVRSAGPERRVQRLAQLAPPPAAGLVLRGPGERATQRDAALRRFEAGDYLGAVQELERFVESNPDDALAYLYLGLARLQLAPDDRALAALERARELGESLLAERARWYLAQARLARGEGELARAELRTLVELDGDYEPNARALLAELERILQR